MFLHPPLAFNLDLASTLEDDRLGNPAAVLKVFIGSVDDGIDRLCSDIAPHNLQLPFRRERIPFYYLVGHRSPNWIVHPPPADQVQMHVVDHLPAIVIGIDDQPVS